ncbi:hypothetical protein L4D08_23745 [Photobacterium chitinilyticum]|uniref:coiled-coil domain-containing protein n=1 Tax=Photobacterium chitinilyticum TaxID=2485123 RepID=UPI003D1200B0
MENKKEFKYKELIEDLYELKGNVSLNISKNFQEWYLYNGSHGIHHYAGRGGNSHAIKTNDIFFESDSKSWISDIFITTNKVTAKEISLITDDGTTYLPNSRVKADSREKLSFTLNNVTSKLTFHNDSNADLYISSVRIKGLDLIELIEVNKKIKEKLESTENLTASLTEELKGDIDNLTQAKHNLEVQTEEKKTQLESLKKEISSSDEYLSSTRERVDELYIQQTNTIELLKAENDKLTRMTEERKILEKRCGNLDNAIERKKESIESINKDINLSKENLSKYRKNESLYSEDLTAYREEISKQNIKYWIALSVIVLMASIVSFNVYTSAINVINEFNNKPDINIINLFISRLPLISINILVIGTCVSLSLKFIASILDNNKEIAELKKIVFLVKEVCDSQTLDLNEISQKEIITIRVREKMAIVREYLFNKEPKLNPVSEVKPKNVFDLAQSITDKATKP